jgi:V/A-type H+-transporting ATPase subunit K
MILMFTMIGTKVVAGGGIGMLILGIFAGLGIGMSAIFQGRAGGCAADAQGETGQGFTNNLAALGIVETTAIFVMVFTLIAVGSLAAA